MVHPKVNRIKLYLALIIFSLFIALSPPAQADDPDLLRREFGQGFGANETGISRIAGYELNGMAIQPDGKYVLVGKLRNDFLVMRYNANGTLDTGFGIDGIVTTEFGADDKATAVAIQPDGKIVAVGVTWDEPESEWDAAVARYLPGGGPDASFNGNGKFTYDTDDYALGNSFEMAEDVTILSDGKIFVVGFGSTDCGLFDCSNHDFLALQFDPQGNLDNTFAGDGVDFIGLGSNSDGAYSVVVQNDGKIVIAGKSGDGVGIARYTALGILDNTFDGDGKSTTTIMNSHGDTDVAVQPNGKIWQIGNETPELVRFNENGSLDSSINGTGRVALTIPEGDIYPRKVRLQHDGSVIVAGELNGHWGNLVVAQFTPSGQLDGGFNEGKGYIFFEGDTYKCRPYFDCIDMLIQDDGKIVVLARGADNMLIRLYPDGTLDNGGRIVNTVTSGEGLNAVTVSPVSGDIYVAGYANARYFSLARYNADGSRDTSFNPSSLIRAYAHDVALDHNNRIVAVGKEYNVGSTASRFIMRRYLSNGILNTSAATTLGGTFAEAQALLIQSDNKIIMGGTVDGDFALTRYNNSTNDTSFGRGGSTIEDFGKFEYLYDLAYTPDGKIIAVGYQRPSSPPYDDFDIILARYTDQGILDTSFRNGGIVVGNNFGQKDYAHAVKVQPDGSIVVAGKSDGRWSVWKFTAAGFPDTTFGGNGQIIVWAEDSAAYDVVIHPGGKIVTTGYAIRNGHLQTAIAVQDAFGRLDTTFSDDGRVRYKLGPGAETAHALDISPNGDIVAVGTTLAGKTGDIATWELLRLKGGILANAAPIARNDNHTTSAGTPLAVPATGILGNDSDADGNALSAILNTTTTNGSLTLNADGSFTYIPNPNFSGTDSFTYYAHDNFIKSGMATVTIQVRASNPNNTSPVAVSDSYNTTEGVTLSIAAPGLLDNDTDADGDPLTAELVDSPANGGLILNPSGSFTYTPTAGFNGQDSFIYRVSDGLDLSETATVTIQVGAGSGSGPGGTNHIFLPIIMK